MNISDRRSLRSSFGFSSDFLEKIAIATLALLNFIGYFKNNDIFLNSPIDITVLSTVLLILFVILSLSSSNKLIKNTKNIIAILPLILFVVLFGFSCLFNLNLDSKYSSSKALKFITITMTCIFVPFLVIKNYLQLQFYFITTLILSILMCYATLFSAMTTADLLYRSSGLGSNPIAAARMCSFIVMYYVFRLQKSGFAGFIRGIAFAIFPIIAIILTGSRGPLIFVFLTIIITYVIFEKSFSKKIVIPILVLAFSILAIVLLGNSNDTSVDAGSRISALISGEQDSSTMKRSEMIEVTLSEIPKYPLGIGIGAFEKYNFLDTDEQYPHNVILEVALELGWFPAIVFISIITSSIYYIYYLTKINFDRNSKLLFCSLIFTTLNMLISGELNGERSFWSLVSISMSLFINRNVNTPPLKQC